MRQCWLGFLLGNAGLAILWQYGNMLAWHYSNLYAEFIDGAAVGKGGTV